MAKTGKFHTIVTHTSPHLDEILGVWLLVRFGGILFNGVAKAKIMFAGAGGESIEGLSGGELELAGVIAIGVGAGQFDEHPGVEITGKEGECASSLVAQKLGIEGEPALKQVLDFTLSADSKGGTQPFDLYSLVKVMHAAHPDDPSLVIEWAFSVLDAKYKEQLAFARIREELLEIVEVDKIMVGSGKELEIFSATTDDAQFNKACRASGAALVIQQQPSGNVQIYTAGWATKLFNFAEVVKCIRVGEQHTRDKVTTTDWKELVAPGKIAGVDQWYFQSAGNMLLNGSLSCPDVEPTAMSLEQIRNLVKIAIDPDFYEFSHRASCKQGKCTSTNSSPCPWYVFGLARCKTIRFNSRKDASK